MSHETLEKSLSGEVLRAVHPTSAPSSTFKKLKGNERVNGGLPDHGLGSPSAHRLFIVHNVIEVGGALLAGLIETPDPRAGAGLPSHFVPKGRWIR